MKTNRFIITVVLIITGSFFVNVTAQEALRAIMKKCENMENLNVNVVRNKDKETKKVTRVMINISFEKNETLKKEILSAFEKDSEMADYEMKNKRNGNTDLNYRFGLISFSYNENRDGRVIFSSHEKSSDSKDGAFFNNKFNIDSDHFELQMAKADLFEIQNSAAIEIERATKAALELKDSGVLEVEMAKAKAKRDKFKSELGVD